MCTRVVPVNTFTCLSLPFTRFYSFLSVCWALGVVLRHVCVVCVCVSVCVCACLCVCLCVRAIESAPQHSTMDTF